MMASDLAPDGVATTSDVVLQQRHGSGQSLRYRVTRSLTSHAVEGFFLLVVVIGFIASPNFLTTFNLDSLLHQAAILGILAVGQYVVIVSGGFDLSVGAVVALSTIVTASSIADIGLLSLPLAVLVGGSMGALSGLAVTVGRIPPFVATLGVLGIARGLAFTVSNQGIVINDKTILNLNEAGFGPVPLVAVIWAVVVVVVFAWLHLTRTGTYVFAIGGNADSARLAGVPVARIQVTAYVLSGCLAGLAGILFAARSSSGSPGIGSGWELDTIAAVVIGGVSLFGGSGSLPRAMLGVLIYLMLTNIMNLANIDTYVQNVLKGALILAAVTIPALAQRRSLLRRIS
jgi:ribose/xylose/arabinose/galactoside ABC-type transport system permease subunit